MSAQYTITAVEGPRDYTGTHGPMRAWKLTLQGPEGAQHKDVELSQKPDTPAPKPGDTLSGSLERKRIPRKSGDGDFEVLRFKKEFGGGGGGFRPRDPKETAAIQWQHSQDMAMAAMRLACDLMLLKPKTTDELRAGLDAWTEWFYRNIERAQSIEPYGQAPVRKDTVRTGQSDIPADAPSYPQTDDSDMPWGDAA